MNESPGFFDELLEGSKPRRSSTRFEVELCARALAALEPGAPTLPRLRTCGRCERLADQARKAGEEVPPIELVESWIHDGRRYFAGLCAGCSDWEWARLWQARYDAACGKGEGARTNLGEQARLVEVAKRRLKSGRKPPVALPPEVWK